MSKGNNRDTAISDSERVSIFSFTKRNSLISFIIFTVLVGLYGTFLIRTYPSKLEEGFFNKFTSIISYVSTFIPVAIVVVLALDLGGAIIMILIGWVKDRRKKEREEQINEAVNKATAETLSEIQAKIDFGIVVVCKLNKREESSPSPLILFPATDKTNEENICQLCVCKYMPQLYKPWLLKSV